MRVSNQYSDRATPMAQHLRTRSPQAPLAGVPSMPPRFAGELQDSLKPSLSATQSRLLHPLTPANASVATIALSLYFKGRLETLTYTPVKEIKPLPGIVTQQWQHLLQIFRSLHFYWTGKAPEPDMKRPVTFKDAIQKGTKHWNEARSRVVFRILLNQLEAAHKPGGAKLDPALETRLKRMVANPMIADTLEHFVKEGIAKNHLTLDQVHDLMVKTALGHVNGETKYKINQTLIQGGHMGALQNPVALVEWHHNAAKLHGQDLERAHQERVSTMKRGLKTWQDAKAAQKSYMQTDLRHEFFLPAKALFAKAEPGSYTPEEMEETLALPLRFYRMHKEKPVVTAQDIHLSEAQAEDFKARLTKLFQGSPELLKQTLDMVAHLEKARDIQMAPFRKEAEETGSSYPLDRLDPNHVFTFSSMTPRQAVQVAALMGNSMPGLYERYITIDLSQHPDSKEQQAQQAEVFREVKRDSLYTRSQHRIFIFKNLEKSLADPKAAPTRALWLDFARNSLSQKGVLSVVGKGDTFGLNKQKDNFFLIPTEKPLDTLPMQGEDAEFLKSCMKPRFPVVPKDT